MAKKILLTLVIFIVIAGITGYILYNKGPVNVREAHSIKITAVELYSKFIKDSATAQKIYSGKILSVSSGLSSVSENQQGEKVIMLSTGNEGGYINCTMEDKNINIKPGQQVVVKGECSGIGQGDADLGIAADVYMSRCYLIE